jgi:thioredoxin-like negative regulator of GroEL
MAGFAVVVNLIESDSGRRLTSVSDSAEQEEDLIATLDRVCKKLRTRLGEQPAQLQASRILRELITPSLAAYMKHREAFQIMTQTGDTEETRRLLHEALELDPQFAAAMMFMAGTYYNAGLDDAAAVWW